MSYRFTNTDKWIDSWFSNLKQLEMLLFIYLCDNCDIAGFIEINYKRWANDLNSSIDTIQGACKGLARGLIYSKTNDCIYIKNFLKHQKNLPLNENNKAHLGILKRFYLYSEKFDIKNINEFIEGACKGLPSPTGIGIGIGNNNTEEKKLNFEVLKENLISIQETFRQEILTYKDTYEEQLLNAFYAYWSEPDKKYRMKKDLQKTWDTKRRLITWENNNKNYARR